MKMKSLCLFGSAARGNDFNEKNDLNFLFTFIRKKTGLRHILVHDYDVIDDSAIWLMIQRNLPVLKPELTILMATD